MQTEVDCAIEPSSSIIYDPSSVAPVREVELVGTPEKAAAGTHLHDKNNASLKSTAIPCTVGST